MGKGIGTHVSFDIDTHDVSLGGHKEIGCRIDQTQNDINSCQFDH